MYAALLGGAVDRVQAAARAAGATGRPGRAVPPVLPHSRVGPVAAFTFKAAVDDPARFAKSKTVGARFGLTPRREQSGTSVDNDGHISKAGDGQVRTAPYEAASAMMTRSQKQCALKA